MAGEGTGMKDLAKKHMKDKRWRQAHPERKVVSVLRKSRKDQEQTLVHATNHRQPWDQDEDTLLMAAVTAREAALVLGGTFFACKSRRRSIERQIRRA